MNEHAAEILEKERKRLLVSLEEVDETLVKIRERTLDTLTYKAEVQLKLDAIEEALNG